MRLEVGPSADLAACHALRRAVFVVEQGIAEADEWDGRDGEALHLLARRDGRPVGTARIFVAGGTGTIGRVCVLAQHRGQGVGRALIEAALACLRGRGDVHEVRLDAQLAVLPFYARLGFRAQGPVHDDAGIPHQWMARPL